MSRSVQYMYVMELAKDQSGSSTRTADWINEVVRKACQEQPGSRVGDTLSAACWGARRSPISQREQKGNVRLSNTGERRSHLGLLLEKTKDGNNGSYCKPGGYSCGVMGSGRGCKAAEKQTAAFPLGGGTTWLWCSGAGRGCDVPR